MAKTVEHVLGVKSHDSPMICVSPTNPLTTLQQEQDKQVREIISSLWKVGREFKCVVLPWNLAMMFSSSSFGSITNTWLWSRYLKIGTIFHLTAFTSPTLMKIYFGDDISDIDKFIIVEQRNEKLKKLNAITSFSFK